MVECYLNFDILNYVLYLLVLSSTFMTSFLPCGLSLAFVSSLKVFLLKNQSEAPCWRHLNFPQHEVKVDLYWILGARKEGTEFEGYGRMELIPLILGSFFCSNLLLLLHTLLQEGIIHKITLRVWVKGYCG